MPCRGLHRTVDATQPTLCITCGRLGKINRFAAAYKTWQSKWPKQQRQFRASISRSQFYNRVFHRTRRPARGSASGWCGPGSAAHHEQRIRSACKQKGSYMRCSCCTAPGTRRCGNVCPSPLTLMRANLSRLPYSRSSSSAYADDPVTTERPVWDAFASTSRGVITGCPA
jgi:hypothetical protein